ncbi:MAG: DUF456 domain-containing protein [Calditrichaeota bacterium]|nr:DUF456 domain-containing protein [Calditrichota bacterium]
MVGTLEIIFLVILAFSLVGIFLSIPGNFIIVIDALWYGLATRFERYKFSFIISLILIALLIELLEYIVIAFGKRGYSANRILVIGAIAGGLLGAISGAFASPVLGTITGGVIGLIVGTIVFEVLIKKNNLRQAKQVMLGALIGRLGPLTVKAIGTLTMIVIVGYKLFL